MSAEKPSSPLPREKLEGKWMRKMIGLELAATGRDIDRLIG